MSNFERRFEIELDWHGLSHQDSSGEYAELYQDLAKYAHRETTPAKTSNIHYIIKNNSDVVEASGSGSSEVLEQDENSFHDHIREHGCDNCGFNTPGLCDGCS